MMKKVLSLILLSCLFLYSSPLTDLDQGNAEYEKGNFNKAIELYNSVINSGFENGQLYYNLGNAYYQTGDLVNTIVSYERALRFLPADDDLKDNLKIVRLSLVDKDESWEAEPFFNIYGKLKELFNIYTIRIFFLIILISISVLFSLAIFFKYSMFAKIIGYMNILLIGIFLLISFIYYDIHTDMEKEFAVINVNKISVLSSPDENVNSKELFFLHLGTKVEVVRSNEEWFEISLSKDKKGWIKKNTVVVI